MPRSVGRVALVLGAAMAVVGGLAWCSAAPAGAVAVRPTDMRSSVVAVEPAAPVEIRIIGGDALVELTVQPGHEVIVAGYDDEPYLRISPDGTVATNRRSPATGLNRSWTPSDPDAADASATAPPDWLVTGSGGRAVWHDHRIHAAEVTQPIAWTLLLTVDGTRTEVHGELRHLDPPSPLPWLALAAACALAAWFGGRHHPQVASLASVFVAALLATVTGTIEWASVPSGTGRALGVVLLPVAALVLSMLAMVMRRSSIRLVLTLGAISLLAGWLAFRWANLTHRVLVTDLLPAVDRAVLAAVLGLVVASAGLALAGTGSADDVGGSGDAGAGAPREASPTEA
ncbi:MAG TPA: hypothetical protein VIJ47_02105 [Acidimicrobiales bacterium]